MTCGRRLQAHLMYVLVIVSYCFVAQSLSAPDDRHSTCNQSAMVHPDLVQLPLEWHEHEPRDVSQIMGRRRSWHLGVRSIANTLCKQCCRIVLCGVLRSRIIDRVRSRTGNRLGGAPQPSITDTDTAMQTSARKATHIHQHKTQ